MSADSAESVHISVKNTSGAQILKGTPVYVTGETGNSGKIEIAPADASDSAKMPALGLLESTLANNGEGFCVQGGLLEGLATATIDGTSTTANDTVYVKSGGGLTMTKPTGTGLIQNIAKVARVHASNGSLVVSSILRTNDVPNLPTGRIWVGDGNTIVSDTVYIDEPNNRVGIGTEAPSTNLDILGASDTYLTIRNTGGGFKSGIRMYGGSSGISNIWHDDTEANPPGIHFGASANIATTPTTQLYIKGSNGNVGIGTINPGTDLEIGDGTGSPGLTLNKATTGTASLFFDNGEITKIGLKPMLQKV